MGELYYAVILSAAKDLSGKQGSFTSFRMTIVAVRDDNVASAR